LGFQHPDQVGTGAGHPYPAGVNAVQGEEEEGIGAGWRR